MRKILLVEDHAESRTSLAYLLERRGYDVLQAANGRTALAIARRAKFHALLLDLKLPDMEGLSVLDAILKQFPGLPVIVVTGFGTIDAAVEAMRRGAVDFLTKPIHLDNLLRALDQSIEEAGAHGLIPPPPSQASAEMERLGIIGRSEAMLNLFTLIKRIAPHQSTVLLLGGSGTGKELIARALHELGLRRGGPFVPINCATLSEQILESELFGHEKGAFTSADQTKEGVMELANNGTLFLDEVSAMGLGCQAKLLRVLERREFRRVGGTKKISVDLNLIAASNVDLENCIAAGSFRADLYYRLKVVSLSIPPLRERTDAIPILARRFLDDVARRTGMTAKRLTQEAVQQLTRYSWPGNVRELRNCIEGLSLVVPKNTIDLEDLPGNIKSTKPQEIRLPPGVPMEQIERAILRLNLEAYPTIKDAARVLGIPLRTFHDKLKRYGLHKPR